MVSREQIRGYVRSVAEAFHPERIILFGSYAHGNPGPDSDVDLLVVMDEARIGQVRPSLAIRRRLHAAFPLDLLVRSRENIRKRLEMGDCFMQEVINQGEVLYAADHA